MDVRGFLALLVVLPLAPPTTDMVELPPLAEISIAALPTEPAVRLDPPAPPATEQVPPPSTQPRFASDCDEMHWYRVSAGLPARFDSLGWRESNCRNEDGVHTSCCYGWWQLNVTLHLRDHRLVDRYHACGVYSYRDVNSDTAGDKRRQACAAKALFDVVGYSAWSL